MLGNRICLYYELSALRIRTFSNIVLFYNSVHRTGRLAYEFQVPEAVGGGLNQILGLSPAILHRLPSA